MRVWLRLGVARSLLFQLQMRARETQRTALLLLLMSCHLAVMTLMAVTAHNVTRASAVGGRLPGRSGVGTGGWVWEWVEAELGEDGMVVVEEEEAEAYLGWMCLKLKLGGHLTRSVYPIPLHPTL